MKGNKNVSKKYPNGKKVQTRDNYLDKTDYYSPGHPNEKDLYRSTVIVDSNRKGELVLVPLTTHNGKVSKGSTGDFIYVEDSLGNKIVIPSDRFKIRSGRSLVKSEVNKIKIHLFRTGPQAKRNRHLVHTKIKNRK